MPKGQPRIHTAFVGIKLSPDHKSRLQRLAEQRGLSMGELVRIWIESAPLNGERRAIVITEGQHND